ncbi:apolipoprotein N-acyltransferase [Chitinophaga sp. YR573]|uniref:nitrilase-related carbon-nitrogen hydrolase n=1 Tax=Chitinophaga sp. YR573 TaxID=1881040 RepID=UPI0008CE16B5|nr:nitrilase-related carbon-nitrogen hydrolase [Chitinophaga sp. YR573]SEW29005.1 apolipoprotein N-acyltransferase [Chitinophaga sp. YR573]
MKTAATIFTSKYSIALSVLLSGLCYYFGNGLNGDFWYLVWLAPIPIICLAIANSGKVAFLASFITYLIGRLSWFWYLVKVATMLPAIIFTLAPALIFAGIILLTRSTALKLNSWYSLFAFPLFFSAFEYLLIKFAPDGTAASIAYSQMNCLPLIQIASVAGILGITFIVTLIPSSIAFALLFRKNLTYLSICSGSIIAGVLLFGFLRLNNTFTNDKIKVGLAVMDENKHNTSDKPNDIKDKAAADFYLKQIDSLASHGVSVILLPERALSIDKLSENEMIKSLINAAVKNNVYIITGYTNLRGEKEYNSAIVINNRGNIVTDYNKVHLVTGLESQFIPGNNIGLFKLNNLQSGIAICKDLDFQDYIRRYGKNSPNILFIPAWDFVVDDWLHSRMSILRGVENGFSEVRAARVGKLTISDYYGRVTDESSSSNLQSASLIGYVPTQRVDTFYTRSGDWVGALSLLLSAFLIFVTYMGNYLFAFKRLNVSGDIPR